MTEISKERREKLRSATQYPFNTILVQAPDPVDTVSIDFNELRALLDLADERDRYRALLERCRVSVVSTCAEDWCLRTEIDAALEGKTND